MATLSASVSTAVSKNSSDTFYFEGKNWKLNKDTGTIYRFEPENYLELVSLEFSINYQRGKYCSDFVEKEIDYNKPVVGIAYNKD